MKIAYLDGPRLRRSLVAACDYIESQRRELNRINVFPVPDGDTGTNLALTVRAIADHLRRTRAREVSVVAAEAAEAAVLGARGNSGMMLSHFLLGFAEHVEGQVRISTEECSVAMAAGVRSLYSAIERPVEGTILTVMRETAEAARTTDEPDFLSYLTVLLREAQRSLDRTPDLLPVLRQAGVVDAGAKGFVNLLEGVAHYTAQGSHTVQGPRLVQDRARAGAGLEAMEAAALAASDRGEMVEGSPLGDAQYSEEMERYRFCTEGLVRGPDIPDADTVRGVLREKGDSLVVIRTGEVLKIHIHTDDPESVFGYLRGLGELATHKAEDMQAQHAALSGQGGHRTLARRPVSLVTESAHDLPEEVIRAHGIHVVPLLLLLGDRVLRDGIDVTAEEFHGMMERQEELPTTSQPSPADFLHAFARAAEDGEEILYVGLGSRLSGTFGSAEAAAARFDGVPVHAVDSRAASILQGLLLLRGAELAEEGVPPARIVERLTRTRDRSNILFTVDTFERLLASGRVGKGKAWFGRLLGLKPILNLSDEGVARRAGKAFGRERVLEKVLRMVLKRVPPGSAPVRFGIVHVGRPEVVTRLTERLRSHYGPHTEILSSPITPVLATHLGPGAWGLAYLVEDI